ncbi:signal peptidase I [Clostridium sp. C2-6-12]|uniref:signal peptidase I n=1 Tax=Clostridium sp. C2-6-12 TaxID=2698832 RepID=UPI0013696173|nr:signal peptidase I [Clostridium sp. C2-6-12]
MIKNLNVNKLFKEWVIPIISALILAVLINKFIFFNVYLPPSGSMIPTLNNYDRVIVSRIYNPDKLQRGNIIVFYSKELDERLVKRLIGIPGDEIEIKNGVVFINGTKLNEDYVKNNKDYSGKFKVPEGKYFFLGDNRAGSYDAREWQNPYIDGSDIEGKVLFRFYPFNDMGFVQ